MLALALAVEEAAKYCCASGLMLLLSALPSQPVMIGGDERQKQWIGKGIASGEMKGAFCLTEPNHGSDAANLEMKAVRDGDDYVLNGEKMYISGGTVADYVVAFARTNGTPGAKGISGFIVPTDTPGFRVAGQDRKMGVRGIPTADIVFEDCRVPRENLIGGAEGEGFNHAMLTLNSCRPVVGARGLGLAEGAMTYALEFARKREAFGKPIADLQAIQFMFADMAIQIEAARLLVYQGAWRVDQGLFGREHAALPLDRQDVRDRGRREGVVRCHAGAGRAGLHDGPPARAPLPRRAPAHDRRGHLAGAARRHRPLAPRARARVSVARVTGVPAIRSDPDSPRLSRTLQLALTALWLVMFVAWLAWAWVLGSRRAGVWRGSRERQPRGNCE